MQAILNYVQHTQTTVNPQIYMPQSSSLLPNTLNKQLVRGAKQRRLPTCELLFKGEKTVELFLIWHCIDKTPTNLTFEILSTQVSAIVQTHIVLSGLHFPQR